MDERLVSVIIVNWNHAAFLETCLNALLAQDYAAFDVTVVDNGSRDGSPQWLAGHYPDVRLIAFPDNRGFCHAFNHAVDCTAGPLVLSLNPDVTLTPTFISAMVHAISQDERIGMVAPKLLRAAVPQELDSTGLFIDRRRLPYDRGQGEPDRGQYDQTCATFGACGAAALYRRTMLEDVALDREYLDEGFFAYYEDADLAWRAQLRGWSCAYAPQAVATHVRGLGDALRKRGHAARNSRGPRLALRNRYLMTLKNDTPRHLAADLPWILASELPRLLYAAVFSPGALLGLSDLFRAFPSARKKRRQVRARCIVPDAALRPWFTHSQKAGE